MIIDFVKNIYYLTKVRLRYIIPVCLFHLFRIFPLKNKVVATTMRGRKYADNPKFILEELHRLHPEIDLVWLVGRNCDYELPSYVKPVPYHNFFKKVYELCTAKIWINSHRIEDYHRKRKGQCFIETWHGGLGIKKIELDVPRVKNSEWELREIETMSKLADVYISNSNHLSNIYRRALGYHGPILKCGYPKNDVLLKKNDNIYKKIRTYYNLPLSTKICLFAPTFREQFEQSGKFDLTLFDIDAKQIKDALQNRFGGNWVLFVKWHPVMAHYIIEHQIIIEGSIDVTSYQDMQELIGSADAVISDYSSCIFDAALREIPCFVYAKDFEQYQSERGVYFTLDELPFTHACCNEELVEHIIQYDDALWKNEWKAFVQKTGLNETGKSAEIISDKIWQYMSSGHVNWEENAS